MKTLKRVGSIVAGAVMLGAAISGAVNAAMDDTGLTGNFFYDAGYNPIVQIVVGEKGMATDAVAAGNIAAVIGNLAYASATAASTGGAAGGQVVLGVSAKGATGKYEQADWEYGAADTPLIKVDADSADKYDFYDDNQGLYFNNTLRVETYERGQFISYSLACNQQERTESGILKKGTYNNVHCLFCETLCLSALQNPEHTEEEKIVIDYNKLHYYEAGLGKDDAETLALKVDSKAITYILDAGYLPMNKITSGSTDNPDPVDFEWRGQFILFGEEYYTKDIQGDNKIYLAKGKILDDISSEGYTSEYMGYKFKIDHLIYSAEYQVAGILLDVEKPDGTVVQTQISKMANGIVDDIEVAGVYAEEADAVATASIIVYDTTTNVLLEDGKDMELGGEVKKYWKVSLAHSDLSDDDENAAVDISDYNDATEGIVLDNVTVEYRHSTEIAVGQALEFPTTYKLIFDGFRTTDFVESPCSGAGEGNIKVEREDKWRALLSFTGDDGQRYNGVFLDQGPFSEGDMFVVDGQVYEYDTAAEPTNEPHTMKVTLKDLLNGGKETMDLDAIAQSTSFSLWKYAFETSVDNDDEVKIEPDTSDNDSSVYIGDGPTGGSPYVLYDGGDIYLLQSTVDVNGNAGPIDDDYIGLNQYVFSGAGGTDTLSKFELDDASLYMSIVNENGTGDMNADRSGNANDRLIQFKSTDGAGNDEYLIVDFYDREFNDSVDVYYGENVLTSGTALDPTADTTQYLLTTPGTGANDYAFKWDNEQDTVAIMPSTGVTATIDYGGARQIQAVSVCQPQQRVKTTVFLGTSEQATTIDVTITKADEGTEKTVGCCSYLVKEFGVTTSGGTAASVKVNPIVGNLVVSEISADSTKNLIIVGGPAVNGMSGVTRDEIQAATGQYVVKKDGNKVYVAGWTAADTIDAGNALISWLQDNAHA